jgi:hypothetical protein
MQLHPVESQRRAINSALIKGRLGPSDPWRRGVPSTRLMGITLYLSFQFADRVVDHLGVIGTVSRMLRNGFDSVAIQMATHMIPITQATSALSYGNGFLDLSDAIRWHEVHRRQVFNAVGWRPTSKPEDEAVCMANMLAIDPGPFLETGLEQHIPQLLLRLQKIPISVLSTSGERHRSSGFSWCLRTFPDSHQRYRAS